MQTDTQNHSPMNLRSNAVFPSLTLPPGRGSASVAGPCLPPTRSTSKEHPQLSFGCAGQLTSWRWLASAVLGVGLLSVPALAQRGGHTVTFVGLPPGSGNFLQAPGAPNRGPLVNSPANSWGPWGSLGTFPDYFPFYSHYPGHWRERWNSAYSSPVYAWSGPVTDGYAYEASALPPSDYADRAASSAPAQITQIQQDEINRLEQEVERLGDEQRESRRATSVPPPTETTEAVLVFRDRHTQKVENYVVLGNTVWVFTELRSQKISISNLDLPATIKANEDQGVDFPLPKQIQNSDKN